MKRVVIESPLSGDFKRNIKYAKLCALDCLRRGEGPYASHLLLPLILDDATPEERKLGMEVGFVWGACAELAAVYQDLGVTGGMKLGIARHENNGTPIEFRNLPSDLLIQLDRDAPAIHATSGF